MSGISGWVRQHRLVTFFGLAFAFAWVTVPLWLLDVMPQIEFQSWGPLIAAIVVIAISEGVAGFRSFGRRLIRWRVGIHWWLLALLAPVAVHLLIAGLNTDLGGPGVDLTQLSWGAMLAAFAFRLVNPLDGPFGEEPGWRGYAVPVLQERFSPFTSTVILGAAAAAWHAPLVFTGSVDGSIDLVTTFVITFVYVWLFNRTGGSTLLVLVFHASEGVIQESAFGATGSELVRTSWLALAVWSLIALSVLVFDRAAWRAPERSATRTSSEPQSISV